MAPLTIQVIFLGLLASSLAQFQSQNFGEFEDPQQFQQPQPQRFASQPQRASPKIRRPAQSHKFIDPQSIHVTPSSSQGFQSPQGRFAANQQFVQTQTPRPASVRTQQFVQTQTPRPAPVRTQQFDTQFVEGPQEAFQQQPPVQAFNQVPIAPQVSFRSQTREPQQPVVVAPVRSSRPQAIPDPKEEEIARQQAESAKYAFQASVTDTLSDTQHVREEIRDGLALKGVYSYSDGYFKRTVHYEADQNGYRVVKEDVEPIGNGPEEDPNGSAEVRSNVGGAPIQYTITASDINARQRQSQQQSSFPQQQSSFPQQQQSFLPQQ